MPPTPVIEGFSSCGAVPLEETGFCLFWEQVFGADRPHSLTGNIAVWLIELTMSQLESHIQESHRHQFSHQTVETGLFVLHWRRPRDDLIAVESLTQGLGSELWKLFEYIFTDIPFVGRDRARLLHAWLSETVPLNMGSIETLDDEILTVLRANTGEGVDVSDLTYGSGLVMSDESYRLTLKHMMRQLEGECHSFRLSLPLFEPSHMGRTSGATRAGQASHLTGTQQSEQTGAAHPGSQSSSYRNL